MAEVLRIALALAVLPAVGAALMRAAGARPLFGWVVDGAVAWLAGVAALAVVTTGAGVLGLPTRPVLVGAGLLVIAGAAVAVARRPAARPARTPRPRWDDVPVALAAAVTVAHAVHAASMVVISNDEYAIWAVRARSLSLAGHLDPDVFLNAKATYQHLDYPLLVPSLVAWCDGAAGHLHDGLAHVALAVTFGAALVVVAAAVTRLAGWPAGVAAVVAVTALPGVLPRFGLLIAADVTLLGFALVTFLAMLLWLRTDDRRFLVLAAAAAVGAVESKVEGMFFVLAVLAVSVLAAPGRRRAPVVVGAVAVAAHLPWLGYTRLHGLESDVVNGATLSLPHLRRGLAASGDVVASTVRQWPPTPAVLVVLAVAALAVAWWAGHRLEAGFVAGVWLVTTTGMLAQYVLTAGLAAPGQVHAAVHAHAVSTGHRVLLFPAALIALATPILAGAAFTRPTREREARLDPRASPCTTPAGDRTST